MINDFLSTLNLLPVNKAHNDCLRTSLADEIQGSSELETEERLSIYRNNVISSLSLALAEIFPVCQQIVGAEFFNALSYEFIRHHLPTSPILSEYGEEFSEFVAQFPPLAGLPYLSEVAHLEYQLLRQTHQEEVATLSTEEIQKQISLIDNPEQSYWSLVPNMILWNSRYACGSVYLAHQPDSQARLNDIDWRQGEYLLLAKQGLWSNCYVLDGGTFQLLEALRAKGNLDAACQGIKPDQLSHALSQLMTLPVIVAINANHDEC